MSSDVLWVCITGDDLIDAHEHSSLNELLPQTSGLYLWRKRVSCSASTASTPEECAEWLLSLAKQPTGVLREQELSHCVKLDGITVGGGGLTREKKNTLPLATSSRAMRVRIVKIMESLTQFMPPIYIGETNNVCKRVSQHFRGETGLEAYVKDSLGLRWLDLEFHYHQLSRSQSVSDDARRVQELMEFIAQRTLSPFGTERPG